MKEAKDNIPKNTLNKTLGNKACLPLGRHACLFFLNYEMKRSKIAFCKSLTQPFLSLKQNAWSNLMINVKALV